MIACKNKILSAWAATAAPSPASDTKRAARDGARGMQPNARPSSRRFMRLRGGLYALGAAAALALLLTLPTAPASADCGTTVEQGSYDPDSNTFTPGTAATDDDIRVTCTESDTDGDDVITLDSVDTAVLPPNFGTGSYIVVNLNGSAPFFEATDVANPWIVTSSGIETTGARDDAIEFYDSANNSIWLEVRGPVTARGDGAFAVNVWTSGTGTATLINRGTINTHGGADTTASMRDRHVIALSSGSAAGVSVATNYGHVETQGASGTAINAYAGTDGTARATNRGTAIVHGGVHVTVNPFRFEPTGDVNDPSVVGEPLSTAAVRATSVLGDAQAVNMAGGTAEARGQASRGLEASVLGGTGDAVAENSGAVTVTGDLFEVTDANNQFQGDIREPVGVAAFNQGAGEARVVNHAGGMIEATGNGGRGLYAWNGNDGTGDATATNRGTIVTRGDRVVSQVRGWWLPAYGIAANSESSNATATNDVGGTVNTHGTRAHGVWAHAEVGTARVVNSGNVTTHNTEFDPANIFALPAYGLNAYSPGGNAEAVNEASGQVTTKGQWAFGILAETQNDGASTSASAQATNRGTVTTEGDNADGMLALGSGGSESNPNTFIARNEAGATITVMGDGADGMVAAINAGDTGRAYGSVRAENHGTITTAGAAFGEDGHTDAGVTVSFFSFTTPIADAGDATVVNTGDVTVSGARATGIRAVTFGSGNATVEMMGGSVTASAVDDAATADVDESGVGIVATTGDDGTASVTLSGNAEVTAPTAVRLLGGTTSLEISNSIITGDVVFGDGTSTLETRGFGLIDGDVTFGAGGEDTLILNTDADQGVSSITGVVTGVHDMIKRGTGIARVNDVTFTGSSLTIEDGSLNVRGHVDLGDEGTVMVEDAGRLTMEVGDLGTDPDDHGRVTAGGGVTFEDDEATVYAAYDPDLTDEQREAAQEHLQTEGITAFSEGTEVTAASGDDATLRTEDESGEETVVGTVGDDGKATLDEDADLAVAPESGAAPAEEPEEPMEPEQPVARDDGDSDTDGAAVVLGGALGLAFLLFDIFPDEEEATAGSFAPVPSTLGWADTETTGAHYWVHALTDRMPAAAGTVGSVQGLNMGFTTRLGDGFHLGLSGMPHVQKALGEDAVEGHRYALQGGWSTDDLFANLSLSRGEYMARTAFSNLDGLGTLGGTFGLRHEQAQAEVGTRIGIGGLSLDPTLSLVAGSLDRDAYTAESAALRSAIPAFSQEYEGWKARVSLAPTDWLGEGSVRWRPELNLATAQTSTDGPGDLSVRQADRAGVLNFTTPARAQALPQTVHALGTAVSIAKSETWKLRGGYLAMMADGELVHAAVARFKLRF